MSVAHIMGTPFITVASLQYRLNQYGGDWMQGYNVLSDEKHREVMFNFDLQLFGGGGGGNAPLTFTGAVDATYGGKGGGKFFGVLAFAALGWFCPAAFGFAA